MACMSGNSFCSGQVRFCEGLTGNCRAGGLRYEALGITGHHGLSDCSEDDDCPALVESGTEPEAGNEP